MRIQSLFPVLGTTLLTLSLATALAQESQEQKAPKETKDTNPVVIRLDNEEIRMNEVEAMIDAVPAQYRVYYRSVGRRQFADHVITMKTLAAEGERLKLDQQPATRLALQIARTSILAEAARREIESNVQVKPADLEQYYNDHLKDFEKVHVRHIRIRSASSIAIQPETSRANPIPTDEEAKKKLEEVRKRIVAGEDFATLAREFSDDLDTAGTGGDLGWMGRGEQVPLESAFALKSGELSQVFQGPYGFELLRVEGRRSPPLDELRSRIEKIVRRAKAEETVKHLREALHPSIDEEYFKPTAPEKPAGQQQLQTMPVSPPH